MTAQAEGILLVNKQPGKTAFSLVAMLRRRLGVKTIGHAGTLDPFATGVMVMLIGKNFTRQSNSFLNESKEYTARVHLGIETDSYDCDGIIRAENPYVPTLEQITAALQHFQGEIEQTPPMFSAKKQKGKKLYELARQGIEVERPPVKVTLETTFLNYEYPHLDIKVSCSKGTYIRSIAFDLGRMLGCGGHLTKLVRTRSGRFSIDHCLDGMLLESETTDPQLIIDRLQRI